LDILNIFTVSKYPGSQNSSPKTPAPSRVFDPEDYLKKFTPPICDPEPEQPRPPSRQTTRQSDRPITSPVPKPPTPAPSVVSPPAQQKPVWVLTRVTKYITTEYKTETTCEC
jgi:hypothetical protein